MEPAAAYIYRHRQASDIYPALENISGIGKSAPRPKKPGKSRKKKGRSREDNGKKEIKRRVLGERKTRSPVNVNGIHICKHILTHI